MRKAWLGCVLPLLLAWCPAVVGEMVLPWVDLDRLPPLPPLPNADRERESDTWYARTLPAADRAGVYTLRMVSPAGGNAFDADALQIWWRPTDGPPRLLHQARYATDDDFSHYLRPDLAVSPDGRQVAWSNQERSRTSIAAVSREGGTPTVLAEAPLATMVEAPVFTPDSRAVVYARWRGPEAEHAGGVRYALRQVGLDGRDDRLFLADGSLGGAWSPDGQRFAYRLGRALHTYQPATGADRVVVSDVSIWEQANSIAWSPDGRLLSYLGTSGTAPPDRDGRGAPSAVYVVAAEGGQPREVVLANSYYAWLPDSSGLLCAGPRNVAPGSLTQIVDLDGRTRTIFGLPEHVFAEARWAPDSASLVAVARYDLRPDDAPGSGLRRALAVGLDGSIKPLGEPGAWEALATTAGLLTLRGRPGGWVGCGPAELALGGTVLLRDTDLRAVSATADGRRVAVVQGLPGAARVLVGPPFVPVAGVPAEVDFAALSPDGASIAFMTAGRRAGVVGVDGAGLTMLPERTDRLGEPAWLPDGQAFLPAPGATAAYTRSGQRLQPPRLMAIELPGYDEVRLENRPIPVPARLSPDGRWLATAHEGRIWLLEARDGAEPRCLADTGAKPTGTLLWPARRPIEGSRP